MVWFDIVKILNLPLNTTMQYFQKKSLMYETPGILNFFKRVYFPGLVGVLLIAPGTSFGVAGLLPYICSNCCKPFKNSTAC